MYLVCLSIGESKFKTNDWARQQSSTDNSLMRANVLGFLLLTILSNAEDNLRLRKGGLRWIHFYWFLPFFVSNSSSSVRIRQKQSVNQHLVKP